MLLTLPTAQWMWHKNQEPGVCGAAGLILQGGGMTCLSAKPLKHTHFHGCEYLYTSTSTLPSHHLACQTWGTCEYFKHVEWTVFIKPLSDWNGFFTLFILGYALLMPLSAGGWTGNTTLQKLCLLLPMVPWSNYLEQRLDKMKRIRAGIY